MRTPATAADAAASALLVLRLWEAFGRRCNTSAQRQSFEGLSVLTGVDADTVRVLVRGAQARSLRTGPSFTTVARLAGPLEVSLDELGEMVRGQSRRRGARG
ncbi:MAG: hypothetical protein ABL966_01740 [Acidimicrobiales bacterium]